MAKAATEAKMRHRTHPIPGTLTEVHGYPQKLKLYRLDASPYWWVRYYTNGKIYRRSTRTENRHQAITAAKDFFDEINIRRSQGTLESKHTSFAFVSNAMLKSMKAEVARRELTQPTYDISEYRLRKAILPMFGSRDVNAIHFEHLEELLDNLSHHIPRLSPSTISSYMKLVRKVFNYAHKRRDLKSIPYFPTVGGEHQPRGFFTTREYRLIWSRARALIDKRFEYRKLMDGDGKELPGQFFAEGACKEGRLVRKTTISKELAELIVFAVNSYVRPTDIKNLQHQHVQIERGDRTYLRLGESVACPIVTLMEEVSDSWG